MKIKFCGITQPKDYLEAIRLGADFVGFIFYPHSPRYLDVAKQVAMQKEIQSINHQTIKRVGVFVNEEIVSIIDLVKEMSLDIVQIHGDEDLVYFHQLKKALEDFKKKSNLNKAIAIWKCVKLNEVEEDSLGSHRVINYLSNHPTDWFLLEKWMEPDNKKVSQVYGGTGNTIGENALLGFLRKVELNNSAENRFKFILAGGLTSKNLPERIGMWKKSGFSLPKVLDFNSGVEESPGVKSPSLMAEVTKVVGGLLRETK